MRKKKKADPTVVEHPFAETRSRSRPILWNLNKPNHSLHLHPPTTPVLLNPTMVQLLLTPKLINLPLYIPPFYPQFYPHFTPSKIKMSCNGCRVLRKGCSQNCILRPCLQWIQTPEAQANATVFVAKFFGRAGLMSFISAVPDDQRQSLFQSLLFEAAGRTINPVNGAVGLLWTGNWHVCQASVETILRGGTLRPVPELLNGVDSSELQDPIVHTRSNVQKRRRGCGNELDLSLKQRLGSPSMNSEDSVTTTCLDAGLRDYKFSKSNVDYNYNTGEREVQILNLFN